MKIIVDGDTEQCGGRWSWSIQIVTYDLYISRTEKYQHAWQLKVKEELQMYGLNQFTISNVLEFYSCH